MAYQTTRIEDIVRLLRSWGFRVKFESGWRTRGSSYFDPKGFVDHHDVSPNSLNWGAYWTVVNGRSDLPGPLANFVLARDGQIAVIAAGRANHAGRGGWKGLSGNSSVWGCEAAHTGSSRDPWPEAQLVAYRALNLAAEIVTRYDRIMTCGHKEWAPTRKTDPVLAVGGHIDMPKHRQLMSSVLEDMEEDFTMREGDRGRKVRRLQRLLNRLADAMERNPAWYPLEVDGVWGRKVTDAVGWARPKVHEWGPDTETDEFFVGAMASIAWNTDRHKRQHLRLRELEDARQNQHERLLALEGGQDGIKDRLDRIEALLDEYALTLQEIRALIEGTDAVVPEGVLTEGDVVVLTSFEEDDEGGEPSTSFDGGS